MRLISFKRYIRNLKKLGKEYKITWSTWSLLQPDLEIMPTMSIRNNYDI